MVLKSVRLRWAGAGLLVAVLASGARAQGALGAAYDAGFSLPSGNIACEIGPLVGQPTALRCDVLSPSFKAPRINDCPLAWGDSLGLDTYGNQAYFICHGDTVIDTLHPLPTLAYGQRWERGGLRCQSSRAGVRCTNENGHGFELARARYKLF